MSTTTKKYSADIPPYLSIAAIAVGLGIIFLGKKQPTGDETTTEDESVPTGSTTAVPAVLNTNLTLKVGSKGAEVKKLQSYMGISSDGSFGPITEARLMKLKGVKQISLKSFVNSPTINQFILKIGTMVMAKNKMGTPIYDAIAKADTSYYSNHKVEKTIPYGREVGKIRSVNPAGNWYAVYYDTFWGQKVGFVKATDVEKI